MHRQHSQPYLVNGNQTKSLENAPGTFDEDWLQKFIFEHHSSIPINEIEPAFGALIPICRELRTDVGPVDILFVNDKGLLTLVECKLWKNPEGRREVIGQILDYAKEISQWSYEDLQNAIGRSHGIHERSLYKWVSSNAETLDEQDFIDNVSRNLRRGRFLLLIIGDGIKENVAQIAEFLQSQAHLNFSFALVEYGVFKVPDSENTFVVHPRIIAQTVEIERAVFRIEDNQIISSASTSVHSSAVPTAKRAKISEQVFFEELDVDIATKENLRTFLARVQEIGIYTQPGQNSLKLKSNQSNVNFGVFTTKGEFYNCGIKSATEDMGQPQIGEQYLDQLSRLLKNGFVRQSENPFWWTVRIKEKKDDRLATVVEMLAAQDKWIEIIQKTLDELAETE